MTSNMFFFFNIIPLIKFIVWHASLHKNIIIKMASIEEIFKSFAAPGLDLDSRSFVKLLKDTNLIDAKFTATDADLIFAKVKGKGNRKITVSQFQKALELVATRKGVSVESVQESVCSCSGPKFKGTVAGPTRLHDDKSTYTGVHMYGGPSTVDKGRTAISDLSEITDRSSYTVRGVNTNIASRVASSDAAKTAK